MSMSMQVTNNLGLLAIGIGLCGLLLVLGQVFLGIAVYHNAKSHCNPNPGMWCALTILFGWIVGIIYLCVRRSAEKRLMVCPQCQTPHPVGFTNCPQCGVHNVYSEPFTSVYAQQAGKKAKGFMIAGIILMAVGGVGIIVLGIISVMMLSPAMTRYSYSYRNRYW